MAYYNAKEQGYTSLCARSSAIVPLKMVDEKWMDHIDAMHELRRGIGLRAYGQNDPKLEYKREGFEMFDAMVNAIREDTVRLVFTARILDNAPQREQVAKPLNAVHGDDVSEKRTVTVKKGRKNWAERSMSLREAAKNIRSATGSIPTRQND